MYDDDFDRSENPLIVMHDFLIGTTKHTLFTRFIRTHDGALSLAQWIDGAGEVSIVHVEAGDVATLLDFIHHAPPLTDTPPPTMESTMTAGEGQ